MDRVFILAQADEPGAPHCLGGQFFTSADRAAEYLATARRSNQGGWAGVEVVTLDRHWSEVYGADVAAKAGA